MAGHNLASAVGEEEAEEEGQKTGKGIRWHVGDKFLDEFDDSHLWAHGKTATSFRYPLHTRGGENNVGFFWTPAMGALLQGALLQGLCCRGLCCRGLCCRGLCCRGLCCRGLCCKGSAVGGSAVGGSAVRALLQGALLQGALLQGALLQGALLQGALLLQAFQHVFVYQFRESSGQDLCYILVVI